MNVAVVMGVGPDQGMGAQLCRRFASFGLHVFVAGRTQAKLDAVAENIRADGGEATPVAADATDEAAVVTLFEHAAAQGRIECAIYNAGNNTPGPIEGMSAEFFEQSWRICCFGGFLFGREAIKHMKPAGGGTILFTGASASLRGRPNFGAFNSSKAALRTLAQAMAKEYGADHIHVGHVVIDGAIDGEKIRNRFPEYAEKLGEAGLVDIGAIVDAYEYLYRQPTGGWSFEVDVRTAIESW
ncbi:MAG: SDR family NAD(P)-dependent oxidoreductase [Gammaproteobacteria bacterium]